MVLEIPQKEGGSFWTKLQQKHVNLSLDEKLKKFWSLRGGVEEGEFETVGKIIGKIKRGRPIRV